MNHEVFITCALTGAGDTTGKNDKVPVTPERLQKAALLPQRQVQRSFIFMSGTLKAVHLQEIPNFTDRSWTVSAIRG